jgi:hypothetical protein
MPDWRRSADRASLQANSLVSGIFSGNFAISVPRKPISLHETAVLGATFREIPYADYQGKQFEEQGFSKWCRGMSVSVVSVRFSHAGPFRVTRVAEISADCGAQTEDWYCSPQYKDLSNSLIPGQSWRLA